MTTTTTRVLTTPDGPMDTYEALPTEGNGRAVIVIQEAFGVNAHIEDVTRRFAATGYAAVSPHLFHRSGGGTYPYDALASAGPAIEQLSDAKVLDDVDACIAHLGSLGFPAHRIAIVGFCMGGRVTFLTAANRSLGAAVGFYGGGIVVQRRPQFPPLIDLSNRLRTPWLGLFGDLDPHIPVAEVEALRERLVSSPVDAQIVRYEGADHGFHCDDRAVFHPDAARDAWERTLAWLDRQLADRVELRREPNAVLTVDPASGIGRITIDRADKLNSITWKMRWELLRCVEQADRDPRVRVVVIRGAGDRAFSAGGDIPEFRRLPTESLADLAYPLGAPERCTKATIAAIDGHCYGGGLEFALSCDFRIATDKSRFAFPEITLGAMPGSGGTQRAVRLMGVTRAKGMVLTGQPIDAVKAEHWGLLTEVVPEAAFDARIEELAQRLAGLSPLAVQFAKETIDNAPDASLSAGLRMEGKAMTVLVGLDHFAEGVEAWKEKRPPVFR